MLTQNRTTVLFALLLWGLAVGCSDSANQQGQSQKESGGKRPAGGEDELDDDGDAPARGADEVFAIWCRKAGETDVTKDELADYYDRFCSGSGPTKLFASTLMKDSYDGSGKPGLKKIEDWQEDKAAKTTTAFLGVSIKLPISIEDHFEKVGPRGGDPDALKQLAEAGGATGDAEVLKTYKNDGKYHVRGWKIRSFNSKKVATINVETETVSRSDHYELVKGEAYMYTQYVEDAVKTIKAFDMLTAGVQVGRDAYLLTLTRIVTDNKTFHSQAVDTIKQTAADTIKAMYKAAEDAE